MSEAQPEDATWVDAMADRFDRAWKAGRRPLIEDFLAGVAEPRRSKLLKELLRIEREIRGAEATPEEYQRRFPGDAPVIAAVVPGPSHDPASTRPDQPGLRPTPIDPPREGQIGKYRLLRRLGRGGQAEAYLARDLDLDRDVVLKLYRGDQPEAVLKEGQVLARVRNPYIAQCYHVDRQGDLVYLVVEYIKGRDLARAHREDAPGSDAAVTLVAQLAEGLEDLHNHGLLHRDIKPSNVILGDDGVPRLVDFGLAAPRADAALRGISGTPHYMAPEQARGESDRIDRPTDVFGLGAVLYELLTGQPPFPGTVWQALEQARQGRVPPPRQVKRSIPRSLERICLKALAAEPSRRYASAAELRRALRRYQRRHRRSALAATAAGLLVLVALGAFRALTTTTVPAPVPLTGELEVRVWAPKKPGLRVDEPGALPVRPDEKIHLEARLNRPAYVYLIWLTGRGEIDTLYPWDRPTGSLPARLIPTAVVESPPELDRGWPLEGSSGLETGLLLARSTPLPADVRLRDLLGPVDPSPLRDPLEVAVLGFGGQLAAPIIRESHRGLGAEAERVDEPLLRLIERLRPHFEVVRAVRFAYQAD